MKKEKILKTVNEMGNNINLNEFLEKLILIDKVEAALEQVKSKQTVSHLKVETYFNNKWKK